MESKDPELDLKDYLEFKIIMYQPKSLRKDSTVFLDKNKFIKGFSSALLLKKTLT